MDRVRTRDGWKLAIYRYRGEDGGAPVLLCHGLGINRHDLDAPDEEISVARYLHGRGHDVWVVELRGAGRSRSPRWPLRRRKPWDFDDHVHRDVPAILRHVLDATGAPSLHWVGHSMGGMLAYAALEHYDDALFASVTTIGSPAFTAMRHPWVDVMYRGRPALGLVRWLPYRRFGQALALNPWLLHWAVGELAANPHNLDRRHLARLVRVGLYDLPAELLDQFAGWYVGEGFARTDGLLDYHAHLGRIRAPVLFIAGVADRLSPIEDLRQVFDAVASDDKELLLVGRETGFSTDYGHIDLVFGKRAREEVYPHIARWIEARQP